MAFDFLFFGPPTKVAFLERKKELCIIEKKLSSYSLTDLNYDLTSHATKSRELTNWAWHV